MSEKAPFGTITTCPSCGSRVLAAAEVCPKCGVRQHSASPLRDVESLAYGPLTTTEAPQGGTSAVSEKRILPTLLFCVLLGIFGGHRFYVGRPVSAVLQLVTIGGLGIWWLVDLILLLTESFKDGNGRRLQEWM